MLMKRLLLMALLCLAVGFLAGHAMNPSTVAAQEGAQGEARGMSLGPAARIHDGKAYVISADDVKQKFPPADKSGKVAPSSISTNLGWDPVYSLVVMRRPYMDPAVKSPNTGNMVHWADAEMHEEKAQLYFIMSGTGQMTLGGKSPKEHSPITNGQHAGEPLGTAQGATVARVKPGDIVVIPTYAWHQAQADPGQTLTYMKVDILTPRLMP
jgi:mannose-6-phosphate isomerase-like protein (cupin superfamily)